MKYKTIEELVEKETVFTDWIVPSPFVEDMSMKNVKKLCHATISIKKALPDMVDNEWGHTDLLAQGKIFTKEDEEKVKSHKEENMKRTLVFYIKKSKELCRLYGTEAIDYGKGN